MARWSYLVPRLIILGLIAIAVWLGSDPIVKYALERTGEKHVGAKVEIGSVQTSLSEGKVYLKDIKIADPENPMLNMLQADTAYVQLDPRELLHRKFVIESGTTTQLKFGSPRTESGAIDPMAPRRPMPPAPKKFESATRTDLAAATELELAQISRSWLDQFEVNLPTEDPKELKTVQLANRLHSKWPNEFKIRKTGIEQIRQSIESLRKSVSNKDRSNPLRSGRVQENLEAIQILEQEVRNQRSKLVELQESATLDRDELIQVSMADRDQSLAATQTFQIDNQTISKLLLAKSQTAYVNEVLHWFRWFQATVPDPKNDFLPAKPRGQDFVFEGSKRSPSFLIKSIDLEGEGRIAGQHLNFAGTASHLTNEPELHDSPISFHLRARGRNHLVIDCVLDRRSEITSDTFNVQCPDLKIGSQILGNRNTLAVAMEPSRLEAEISLRIDGDKLSGEFVFQYSDVLMHVNEVHALAGGQDTALKINSDLASVKSFQTYVQLSGTLENPNFEFRSDLGNKFAAAMNKAAADQLHMATVEQRNSLQNKLDEAISSVDEMMRDNFRQLATLLNDESERVAKIQQAIPEQQESWPRIR